MKQILMTLMASCPFSVRWDQCWGLNEDGARVPCPYPLGAPHILGIARVAEDTNIHPSTDIHIYACAYKCTYMCFQVSWILRMCLHVHECMSVIWYVFSITHIDVYIYICSHMHQNVLVTNHTMIDIYIYHQYNSSVPWVNFSPTFGWLVQRFRGGRRAPGTTGERWVFTEDGDFSGGFV